MPATLEEHAREFATDLTATVRVVSPQADPFVATLTGAKAFVRQAPTEGITLHVAGVPVILLRVSFECTWDSSQTFLAVEEFEPPSSRRGQAW